MKKTTKNNKANHDGVSLKKLNYILSAVSFTVSVLMLVSLYLTAKSFDSVRDNTYNYIRWERSAENLQIGSDYLTEQARSFAVTGERSYLDSYFKEANVTKRRDKALADIKNNVEGSDAYGYLETAMNYSVELMIREYYSMRLTVAAFGYDVSEYPEIIRQTELTAADAALSQSEQAELARNMVFDDVYMGYKDKITKNINNCVERLAQSTEAQMSESIDRLNVLLLVQRILVIALVITIIIVIFLTSIQVIRPLLRAVPRIKEDQPLSVSGAYEYKFLAKTYNKMFEANKAQTAQLKFEATHDTLTGTYNRSGFENICMSGAISDYAVLYIDVDNFKKVNDTYGHPTGDTILVKVAEELKKNFRSSDYICRSGGDEFIIIMNDITSDPAREGMIKEKIYKINESLSSDDNGQPAISISAGVAFGHDADEVYDVSKKADKALYNVKYNGKHDVGFFDETL